IRTLHQELEDEIAHREIAEEHAERHQRERNRKSEHDEDDEQGEHQHAKFGIAQAEHQMSPLPTPAASAAVASASFFFSASSRMTFSSSSTSCRRRGHSPSRMHITQRHTSTMPWITMSTPTITISHLNGQTTGPLGLAGECSFLRRDRSAKAQHTRT